MLLYEVVHREAAVSCGNEKGILKDKSTNAATSGRPQKEPSFKSSSNLPDH